MSIMLIADDSPQLLNILNSAARKEGFETVLAQDGQEALDEFYARKPQVILLDVMMPKLDGFQVCREIRRQSDVPVIMVTARGEDFEKIMGLDIGADDYIVKPFSPGEVMARVRAVLRRIEKGAGEPEKILKIEDLMINLENYSVTIDNRPILLTKRETDMLWTLASGKNRAYTREMLLDLLWGYDYYGDPRTVDSHMKRLRAKLEEAPHPMWEIRTIRNVGYKFEVLP
ncbi:response regulator transcription factor [Clostridium boliviensis]|uniref:Stage 0 sporulation protein A homolog n=1 Tax=Clostridium boliviensis TaxID=318465 RepID=A0ABU4GT62_9CLOT|nr:response regulator transcription factor [Clostridium boliviensis]MDW2800738.1 response regulator transcription factor [Clostridium boliviensis]